MKCSPSILGGSPYFWFNTHLDPFGASKFLDFEFPETNLPTGNTWKSIASLDWSLEPHLLEVGSPPIANLDFCAEF